MTNALINNVSHTALWVAYYRAQETKRSDALFKDPLALLLMGERGQKIAEDMNSSSRFSEYTVVMRTMIIDGYIQQMIREGIDTVLNLGAGLDTRPYRMNLPETLKWIEVDYPNIIDHKNKMLKLETPKCHLIRIALDLADDQKREAFLKETSAKSKKILVITEGVVLYLSEAQASALSADLHRFPEFAYWIVEYLHPKVYPHLKTSLRAKKLKNAPLKFFPKNWIEFFNERGWVPKELKYMGEEGAILGRPMPIPRVGFIFRLLIPKSSWEKAKKMSGFILLERKN